MKYIDLRGAYLLDNYQDLIKLDSSDVDLFNIKVPFEMKHILFIRGKRLKPKSKSGNESELFQKRKIAGNFGMCVVADTDINILSEFMERDMYENINIDQLIRYSDIEPMLNLVKQSKKSKEKINLLNFSLFLNKKICILFINYETRERIYEYINGKKQDIEILSESYKIKGFVPALTLNESELKSIDREFKRIKDLKVLSHGDNFFINPRNSSGETVSDNEKELTWNTLERIKFSMNDTIEDTKKEIKDKKEVTHLIQILKEHTIKVLENEIKNIEYNHNRIKDINPRMTFDNITLARHSTDIINEIFDTLEKNTEKNLELLLRKDTIEDILFND